MYQNYKNWYIFLVLCTKYKRLDKIDFYGTIHISDKPTKTDMIIVHPGDLVISGINVAKGTVARLSR